MSCWAAHKYRSKNSIMRKRHATFAYTLQGVSKSEGLGNKNRIEATVHADISYQEVSTYGRFHFFSASCFVKYFQGY